MTLPTVGARDLERAIDRALDALGREDPEGLMDLASILRAVAHCHRDKPYLFVFDFPLFMLADTLAEAQRLARVPSMEEPERTAYRKRIADAVENARTALIAIKSQCTGTVDYEALMGAAGTLIRDGEGLSEQAKRHQDLLSE